MLEQLLSDEDIQIGKNAEKLEHGEVMYACSICGATFYDAQSARICSEKKYNTCGLRVGDLVVIPGYFNHKTTGNDDPWYAFTIEPDEKNPNNRRVPWFVVTALHQHHEYRHTCIVTVCSLIGGKLSCGWNPATGKGHYAMFIPGKEIHCDQGCPWKSIVKPYLGVKPSVQLVEEAGRLAAIGISTRKLL